MVPHSGLAVIPEKASEPPLETDFQFAHRQLLTDILRCLLCNLTYQLQRFLYLISLYILGDQTFDPAPVIVAQYRKKMIEVVILAAQAHQQYTAGIWMMDDGGQ